MSATVHHRPDRAVVALDGALDWDGARALADALEVAVEGYFYRVVELVVTSPGGELRALRFVLDAMGAHRARGVRLRTRVLSDAQSAAAVLCCLGDERIAAPGARLLLHASRALNVDTVTAPESAALGAVLERHDAALVALLVERALGGVDPDRALGAEPADRAALEHLLPGRRGRGLRALARTLGRRVTRAVRIGDRATLERTYRRLLAGGHALSAPLARTLGLIDAVVAPGAVPVACDAERDGLVIPEWAALFPTSGAVPRALLTRHLLVLGETGSGKTASAILPVVAAMARAPAHRLGAALVIDPKCELAPVLERLAPQRLRHLRAGDVALDLMAGPRHRLDADLAAGRWIRAATRIALRVAAFVPASPMRTLRATEPPPGVDPFFAQEGAALACAVLALVLMLTAPDAPAPGTWLAGDPGGRAWVEALLARAAGTAQARGPNAVALTAWALAGPLLAPVPASAPTLSYLPDGTVCSGAASRWLFARIARASLERTGPALSDEGRDLLERVGDYWAPMADVRPQFAGVRASAATACAALAAPAAARTLYFGCEPGARAASVDFARAVAPRDDAGPLVLFQPARDDSDALVAVALKALFFEAVLESPERARAGSALPLVGYVADEAHRFLTSDPVHGEQSFLDTCRSFGAMCVLACQSVASFEHALAHRGGSPAQNKSAVAMLWSNTASKLVFRTTDPQTAARVGALCPLRPDIAGVTRVRPPGSLQTGECYALLADGRFERRALERFAPPDAAPSHTGEETDPCTTCTPPRR